MNPPAPSLIEAAQRVQGWLRERPILIDVGIAVVAAILGLVELNDPEVVRAREPDALAVLLVLASAFTLIWRRSSPLTVLALVFSALSVVYLRGYDDVLLTAAGIVAIYSAAAHGAPRRRAWIAITTVTVAVMIVSSVGPIDSPNVDNYVDAIVRLVFTVGIAVTGAVIRNRHEIFLSTEARADKAEADRAAAADRAVANERLRIAREMHDVVSHGVGVMAVQAAAARETLETQPDRTRDLLLSIETTGRESLMEMRRMLGVLRNGEDHQAASETKLSPQPSLNDLEKLVSSCIETGTPTELVVSGYRTPLSPGVELAAFRIVQEALNNVRKHGGTAATIRVEVRYSPNNLHLTITDTGRGAAAKAPTTGSGNGLVGMRERVDAYGGELWAGPRHGGGYQVSAQLPMTSHQNRHHVDTKQPNVESSP